MRSNASSGLIRYGLYPTFKEWKQDRNRWVYFHNMFVYILPLRNENLSRSSSWLASETSVYILPLRNDLAHGLWPIAPIRSEE